MAGPRPTANVVIIVLLVAVLGFASYLTFDMARLAIEGPGPAPPSATAD